MLAGNYYFVMIRYHGVEVAIEMKGVCMEMKVLKLPNRLLKIYHYIYENPNLTIDDLVNHFHKSTRSMYTYIKEINEIIEEKSNKVVYDRKTKGYHIEVFPEIMKQNHIESQSERISYLLQYLLQANAYTKIEDLADQIYVSSQTIKNDLKQVKKKLTPYHIEVNSKPYYGIKIQGLESNIRKALSAFVMDHQTIEFTKNEQEFFSEMDIYAVSYCLLSVFNGNHISIPDYQIKSLVFQVAVALKRIKQGACIEKNPMLKIKEIAIFEQVIQKCETFFHIEIPQIERLNLYLHFATKMPHISLHELGQDIHIEQIAARFIKKLDTEYQFRLGEDKVFVKDLILHIESFVKRITLGVENRNPLLAEIKSKYAFEYNITLHCMQELIEKYDVSEDEIGFLTLHVRASLERNHQLLSQRVTTVTLVCATGLGTERLLETKLLNAFGEQMMIEKTITYHDYQQLDKVDSDLVITTLSIPMKNKTVICIHPLLSRKDELRLQNQLYKRMNDEKSSYQLFKPDLFKVTDVQYQSKKTLIRELTLALEAKGFIGQNYYQEVLKREAISSTALSHGIAIPHAIESSIYKSFIYICIIKKGIQWDLDKKVNLVFLFGIKNNDLVQMRLFNHVLTNYLDNNEATKLLTSTETFDAFKATYMSFLDKD